MYVYEGSYTRLVSYDSAIYEQIDVALAEKVKSLDWSHGHEIQKSVQRNLC